MARNTNKFGAVPTTEDGIVFASKKEAQRYRDLKLMQQAGEIRDLALQPRYELQPAFKDAKGTKHQAIAYVADFGYIDAATGRAVVEDTKGVLTREFRLKRKLLLFRHPALDLRII